MKKSNHTAWSFCFFLIAIGAVCLIGVQVAKMDISTSLREPQISAVSSHETAQAKTGVIRRGWNWLMGK